MIRFFADAQNDQSPSLNLMVIDVSELLINEDAGFQEKYGKFMVTFLTYLAAKLESAPESIKGRIALVSNHRDEKRGDGVR